MESARAGALPGGTELRAVQERAGERLGKAQGQQGERTLPSAVLEAGPDSRNSDRLCFPSESISFPTSAAPSFSLDMFCFSTESVRLIVRERATRVPRSNSGFHLPWRQANNPRLQNGFDEIHHGGLP